MKDPVYTALNEGSSTKLQMKDRVHTAMNEKMIRQLVLLDLLGFNK